MSKQDKIRVSDMITTAIRKAQRELYERKAKLGENVVVADANGMPVTISAEEALRRINKADCK